MTFVRFRTLLVLHIAVVLVVTSSCRRNHEPDAPAVLAGPDSCFADSTYAFKATVSDMDGDSVQVRMNWGDSTLSDWQRWIPSGDTVVLTHAWTDTGLREITAQAQDQRFVSSNWSTGLGVRVVQPRSYRSPNAPDEPAGPAVGGRESLYFFTTVATHPDSIPVAIRFAWGDGDTSVWSAFVASGESVQASHAWQDTGTHVVTAQAKDTGGALSPWSLQHDITIRPLDLLLRWRLRVAPGEGVSLFSCPAIALDGTVYVGSPDSAVYAINPDGTLKWRRPSGFNVWSSPAIAEDGTVYVGSYRGCLYAINPDSTLKWQHQFGAGSGVTTVAIAADSMVYCGVWTELHCLTPDIGWQKYTYQPANGATIRASAAIAADGAIYVPTQFNRFIALYPDLRFKWDYNCWGVNLTSPAIAADGTIYFGSERGTFSAVYPDSTDKWGYPATSDGRSSPAVGSDGTVYFGSTDNCLYALNPDGSLKWRYETGDDVDGGPAIAADGTLYFGSDDDCLYAVNADGTLKWRYKTGGHIRATPTIGTDGTVYFTCGDGFLYALNGTSPLADSPWPKAHHDLRNTGRAVGDARWSRMDLYGVPSVAPDSSGFMIRVVNAGNTDVSINSLKFTAGPDSAYMRDFLVDSVHGYGYPKAGGQAGTKPIDTLSFAPRTVMPTQRVDLSFLDFHVDSLGTGPHTNVVGKEFRIRFDAGPEILIRP